MNFKIFVGKLNVVKQAQTGETGLGFNELGNV